MDWEDTTIRTIEIAKVKRVTVNEKQVNKVSSYITYEVPAVYHRLVCQLVAEEAHGLRHHSHKSRCRQMYARRVLAKFADEMVRNTAQPPTSFWSLTLTTILQRQLRAVHDAYMPFVHAAIVRKGEDSLTISRVTEIYLREDPTCAYLSPHYCHHLLYIPEPRWYLATVVNPGRVGDAEFYNVVREHHEQILMAIREEKRKKKEEYCLCDSHGMPVLRRAEVRAIILEGLEDIFAQELSTVVFRPTLPIAIPGTDRSPL